MVYKGYLLRISKIPVVYLLDSSFSRYIYLPKSSIHLHVPSTTADKFCNRVSSFLLTSNTQGNGLGALNGRVRGSLHNPQFDAVR